MKLTNINNLPQSVHSVAQRIVAVAAPKKLILFGSRARGDHRNNSDVDFVVVGKTCTSAEWTKLLIEVSEEPLSLYPIDLVEYERLGKEYQDNISLEGKVIYERSDKL